MGRIAHHAIVVTTWKPELLVEAHRKAEEFGCAVSSIVVSPINGYRSFLVAPDGSKEGWSDSDRGDEQRDKFIAWMNSKAYDDGSNALRWAEVFYGEDVLYRKDGAKVTRHGWGSQPEGQGDE